MPTGLLPFPPAFSWTKTPDCKGSPTGFSGPATGAGTETLSKASILYQNLFKGITMFTGIIETLAHVETIVQENSNVHFTFSLRLLMT